MKFSIITSLYKSDKYLLEFEKHLRKFASDLGLAGVDFELIAIANDPTEKEKAFAKSFSNDTWFKFINVPRESLYATWNRGVAEAKGEFVGFWNVDDVRFASALVEAVQLFKTGAMLVHFPFYIKRYLNLGLFNLPLPMQKIDRQIPEYSDTTRSQFLQGMVCGPFFIFSKALYKEAGPFDEQFKIAGDFDWCVRAAKVSSAFKKAKSLGGIFRVDGGGLSAGGSDRQKWENAVVDWRNKKSADFSVEFLKSQGINPEQIVVRGEIKPWP